MTYLGDCRTILDDLDRSPFNDATEMQQVIDNSTMLTKDECFAKGCEPLSNCDTFGYNGNIFWQYDSENDVHHFFRA